MNEEQLDQAKLQFEKDGYAVVRDFVSREEADQVNREIERYVAEVVPTLPPEEAFYESRDNPETLKQLPRISQHDEYFRNFHSHPRMSTMAAHVLGCDVLPRDLQWFNKIPQHSKPTPVHQDGFYDKIEPVEMVTMWLALDIVDEENGCVRYVVGSHKQGLREHTSTNMLGFSQGLVEFGPADRAREVAVCAEPGDLLMHHGLTIHLADANTSNRHRRALGSVYYGAHVEKDQARYEKYQNDLTRDLLRDGKI